MIVPPDITKTWANEYAKNNAELVEEVNNAYKERYARLESQHQVAQVRNSSSQMLVVVRYRSR
jgi:hypothetical protein